MSAASKTGIGESAVIVYVACVGERGRRAHAAPATKLPDTVAQGSVDRIYTTFWPARNPENKAPRRFWF
ncbi:hypothetical protein BCEP4_560055 [Burkholderia cepacia]|nr:hypothetical protein BCEP4_560055 [Burkholderia cepacia]